MQENFQNEIPELGISNLGRILFTGKETNLFPVIRNFIPWDENIYDQNNT